MDGLVLKSHRYNFPTIYVTESGTSLKDEHLRTGDERYNDELRCEYFRTYIEAMARARRDSGVDVRGYMAWSFLECVTPPLGFLHDGWIVNESASNFEWAEGYVTRFGVTYVDYADGQKRYPKKSAGVVRETFDRLIEPAKKK